MKSQKEKSKDIFLVFSGHRDDRQIRYLSFDYEDTLAATKKIVSGINRKNGQKNKLKAEKFYTPMHKEKGETDAHGYGEVVVDHWRNNISFVEIVLFKTRKEYSPDWSAL